VLARGKLVFEQGLRAVGVRPCAGCHGDNGEGASGFPRLAGQHAGYLERQLNVFGTRLRPHGVLMRQEVSNLKPADRKAVAAYLQSL
jgi:cytochrome c553